MLRAVGTAERERAGEVGDTTRREGRKTEVGGTRTDETRIFVERILGSIRADTFNTTIEICLPMTMRTVQPEEPRSVGWCALGSAMVKRREDV